MSTFLDKTTRPSDLTLTITPGQCLADFRDTMADLIASTLHDSKPFRATTTDLLGRTRTGLLYRFDDIDGYLYLEDDRDGHTVMAIEDITSIHIPAHA